MTHRIGIVGASGYGGGELLRLLAGHPAMDVEVVAAHSQQGAPISSLFPNLAAGDRVFDAIDPDQLAGLDLVFLSTPHGPALELGAALHDAGTPVVDLSAAFRLSADGFREWYGEEHPRPDLAAGDAEAADTVAYGLPELYREDVRRATLIANPGCYPTAAILGLAPLVELAHAGSVVVDAKSGTSGAGREAKDRLHFTHVHADFTAYAAPRHRHTGEIERWLPGELGNVSFTPHLVPMSRGILATSYASLREGVSADDVQSALLQAYRDEPFVHVLEPGTFPNTKALGGSNGCHVSAVTDPRTSRVTVTSAIDNLGKGAAGQALQCANLVLGLDEPTGLTAIGVYP